ncbi:hypothetical protein GUJ93_ZPchr0002g24217 [Zizania palustris]|uniref:Uncharacterized protein n=1 Tax=Zizania palustris TaxID=103762 RepID=A0A8J5SLD7_ZIZPA|nr:hypothetical protein GUJ93_ZPchr0002g24217 [Zizania palustris]
MAPNLGFVASRLNKVSPTVNACSLAISQIHGPRGIALKGMHILVVFKSVAVLVVFQVVHLPSHNLQPPPPEAATAPPWLLGPSRGEKPGIVQSH